MRKVVFSSVALLAVVICGSAQAGKYNCEFQKDGTALHKCAIDSAGSQTCEHNFSGTNLRGMCGVNDIGSDLLVCAITRPAAAAATFLSGLPRGPVAAAANALAQKPGFVAGGLTIAPSGQGTIAGVYIEKEGAPTLAGVCTP